MLADTPSQSVQGGALQVLQSLLKCSLAHVSVQLRTAPLLGSSFFIGCLRLTCLLLPLLLPSCRKVRHHG